MIYEDIASAANKTYDFIIVGGGTAGLTLAARLSENSRVTVAVLEAGNNTIDDPLTLNPARYGQYVGKPEYDWGFLTTIQRHSNDRQVPWSRGKGLGGTSSTNFFAWCLPPVADVDAFEKLGNPGWNWDEFHRYVQRIEKSFQPVAEGVNGLFDQSLRGEVLQSPGSVWTTLPAHMNPVDSVLQATFINKGIKVLDNPYLGNVNGTWIAASTIDPTTWTRSSSATAYLFPIQDRPNLKVFTQAVVSRVIFADNGMDGQDLAATGVEVLRRGSKYVLNAHKEVILSAGTIKDPHILELSGIGRCEVLSKIGVETKLELPGVGENLQDHNVAIVTYELDPIARYQSVDLLRNPETEKESLQLDAGMPVRTRLNTYTFIPLADVKIPDSEELIAKIQNEIKVYKNTLEVNSGIHEQLNVHLDTLRSGKSPDFEFAAMRVGSKISLLTFLVHPLSRGTIHVRSHDPLDNPDIDPHYFERGSDLEVLVQGIKYIRSLAETEPLKSVLMEKDLSPGPQCTSDGALREYIKNTHITAGHAIGTCSMLPRDKQGVVDPQLKVYGTKNLRVVDISIIPLQMAAHTQAAAYVIGEKAADIILGAC